MHFDRKDGRKEGTPWSRVLFEKQTIIQLVKKFPPFMESKRSFTVFTKAYQWSLS